jgi:signal transduction histidine kinase
MRAPPNFEAAELWQASLELEPSGVAVLSGDELRVRVVNPAFRSMIPPSPLDPVGRPVEEVWPGEVGRRMRAIAARVLASGEPALHERYAQTVEGGSERVFSFHLKRLPLRTGHALLLVVWDTSDVEEARRAAERARERAELLAAMAGELSGGAELDAVFRTALARTTALLGAADGALWLVDPDGRRLRGFLETRPLGRAGELLELAGHPHSARAAALLAPVLFSRGEAEGAEAAWLERLDAGALLVAPLVESGRCTGLLQLLYREGGRWPRPEDVDFAEAIASQCSLAVARARVFEAERQARARAEAAEAEARRVGDLQERLAAVVGHDLRTPLAVIRLSTETLAKREAHDPGSRRALARIAGSAARMEAIIRDLLDFARVRGGGGIPVALGRVQLDEVATAAVQEAEAATGRHVRLEVSGDCAMRGDASRLGQIVSNLVGNALHHGPPGAGVDVRVEGGAGELAIEVHNEGPPIAPDVLPRLFEPFRRGPQRVPEDAHSGHLGLGLFIVAEIARAHGGGVTVRSVEGQGTTFRVALPRGRRPERSIR